MELVAEHRIVLGVPEIPLLALHRVLHERHHGEPGGGRLEERQALRRATSLGTAIIQADQLLVHGLGREPALMRRTRILVLARSPNSGELVVVEDTDEVLLLLLHLPRHLANGLENRIPIEILPIALARQGLAVDTQLLPPHIETLPLTLLFLTVSATNRSLEHRVEPERLHKVVIHPVGTQNLAVTSAAVRTIELVHLMGDQLEVERVDRASRIESHEPVLRRSHPELSPHLLCRSKHLPVVRSEQRDQHVVVMKLALRCRERLPQLLGTLAALAILVLTLSLIGHRELSHSNPPLVHLGCRYQSFFHRETASGPPHLPSLAPYCPDGT